MRQYLLSLYQPVGDPLPAADLEPVMAELAALNEEMKATGAWVFAAGLHPTASATVVRDRDGEAMLTDGPFAEGKEHLGGFTAINALDLDAALVWAGRLARVTGLPVEVRPIAFAG
ncbi:YciI family protein [Actinoplanes sp. DH11]|uniref:YciI family protein n=1 Tax=Actinoplanes sp. DH11 TaxID=2857011 RepID=UPI001E59FD68|nr:YciI family protein [Actinoplanes sp. DH11]